MNDAETLSDILEQSANDIPPAVENVAGVIQELENIGSEAGGQAPDTGALHEKVKRKRGRPPKTDKAKDDPSTPRERPIINGADQRPQPGAVADDPAIAPCAEILTMLTNASGMVLAQGDAGAMTKDEQMLVRGGYVAYLRAKGVTNVPPWVILAGALSPYYLRIITTTPAKTTVASGLRKAWFGVKEFFISRKNKYAHDDNRDNVKRKINASEADSEKNL